MMMMMNLVGDDDDDNDDDDYDYHDGADDIEGNNDGEELDW